MLMASTGHFAALPHVLASQATPDASDDFPRIAIVPRGDYPDGYIKDVVVEPGVELQLTVDVVNFGSVPTDVKTFKVNALSAANGGFLAGAETDPPLGATGWLNYIATDVHLEPGRQREITFDVSVPSDVAPGQYITGLMVQTADPVAIPGSNVLDQLIGYVMSISFVVEGQFTYSFELGVPEVTERSLEVPISNTGNYLVKPAGELSMVDDMGRVVLSTPIRMGSVYAGTTTAISVGLPEQMPAGDYSVSLSVQDESSGASGRIEEATVTIEEPEDPTAIYVANSAVTPNADPITFANVEITLDNGGQEIPATDVTLEVMRDGELVEEYPLATNQVLLSGENQYMARYIPAEMWESGTYTFNLVVSAVDPNGGQETILLDQELDATIEVP